ncbi:sel1 repeat family protein [Streptomyces sp. SAS_269]|uniref:sel1 repeat family protein n=1 Tax=Streptomyces sp. SAS_269 TaxID=3412749 RepID=UPI00403C9348
MEQQLEELAVEGAKVLIDWLWKRPGDQRGVEAFAGWFERHGQPWDADLVRGFHMNSAPSDTRRAAQDRWSRRVGGVLAQDDGRATVELVDIVKEYALPARPVQPPATAVPARAAPAGDHVDFRRGTFHAPVIGVQHNTYGTHPGGAALPGPETWPQVGTADCIALGVHRAQRLGTGNELPPYVGRDADHRLVRLLHAGGLVVVTGEPLSGKSRTAWQAVRNALPENTRVYAPSPGADLRALPGVLRERRGSYLLWLDDLDGHLGELGLDVGLPAQLAALRVPVVATMNDEAYDAHRFGGGRAARVLSRVETVELAREWSPRETAALEAVDDPRLAGAREGRGRLTVTEYLAVGPELWDEWRRARRAGAHPAGHFLVRAAADAARCGLAGPLSARVLGGLVAAYFADVPQEHWPEQEWESREEALAWAVGPRLGVTGLLVPDTEDADAHEAYGSLRADLDADEEYTDIPVYVWLEVMSAAETAGSDAVDAVARAANRELSGRAEEGDGGAMAVLGVMAQIREDRDGCLTWFEKAVAAGLPSEQLVRDVNGALGDMLVEDEQYEKALPYLREAAEHGDANAAYTFARALRQWADHWIQRAAADGHAAAKAELASATDTVEE